MMKIFETNKNEEKVEILLELEIILTQNYRERLRGRISINID